MFKPILSRDELDTLDRDGYLILRNLLSLTDIEVIKEKILSIKTQEGCRMGEYGTSPVRESLITHNRMMQLRLFDALYQVVKFTLNLCFNLLPFTKSIFFHSIRKNPSEMTPFRKEFNQMLITVFEQFDKGDERICDLVNKGEEFSIFFRNPKVLAAVNHVIGPNYKLSSLNLRSPKKNSRSQGLHVDYPWAVRTGDYYACNALWLLDDMTLENGPTRVVPGSHKKEKSPNQEIVNIRNVHPDEIRLTAKAGDVIFLNSHTWHGGTSNQNGNSRAIIQSYFVHRAHPPQQCQRAILCENTSKYLSEEDKRILDIL